MKDEKKELQSIAAALNSIKEELKKQTAIWKQINDKTHSWNIPNPDGCDDEDDNSDDDLPEMGDTTKECDK